MISTTTSPATYSVKTIAQKDFILFIDEANYVSCTIADLMPGQDYWSGNGDYWYLQYGYEVTVSKCDYLDLSWFSDTTKDSPLFMSKSDAEAWRDRLNAAKQQERQAKRFQESAIPV